MRIKKTIILYLLIYAQYIDAQVITGKIIDIETQEPLPFASIQNLNSSTAALSDLNGLFKISARPSDQLKISYLGYETQILYAKDANIIQLKPKNIEVQGITITAKDNPAYRYIQLIQQNAERNNPLNLSQFIYTSYNKMKIVPENKEIPDSQYQNFFQKSDLFFWESVTERKYKKPNKTHEVVKASKMSGLPGMVIPFSPTDLQDLSFYENWVKVLGVENLSPIASTALNHYEYEIEDTLFVGKDSILTIKFYPRKNKVGFTGSLKVHTKYYHLVSIIANMDIPEDFVFAKDVKIQQLYEQVNDTFWFPTQLNTNILLNIYVSSSQSGNSDSSKKVSRTLLTVESYLKDIYLDTTLKAKNFSNVELEIDQAAAQFTDKILEENRIQPLTEKEKNTYIKIDSLGKKAKLASIVRQMNKLQQGFIGFKFFDLDLKRIYYYNWQEKSRLGLGLQSNEKISNFFHVGAWVGYGFGDKKWKYGAFTQWYPFKNKEFRFHFNYENSLRELGSALRFELKNLQWLYQYNPYSLTVRDFYIKNWEYYQHYSASLFFPVLKSLNLELKAIHEKTLPTFDSETENFSELSLKMRFAPIEKLTRYNGKLFIQDNKGPLFWSEYRTGLKIFDGTSEHQTLLLGYQQKFNLHKLGKMQVWGIATQVFGNKHLSRYIVTRTMGKPSYICDPQTFNTLPFNIFTAEQQIIFYLKHFIQNPNFPSKKYSPDMVIFGQGYYGKYQPNLEPNFYETFLLDKGYAEVGIGVFNILPEKLAKVVSSLRFLGMGIFYRAYGNYPFLQGYSPWAFRIITLW